MEKAASFLQVAQAVLAGTWLGCLVFTTLVVSPALKGMDWPETTRVQVRSRIGRSFRRVANPLVVLLLIAVILAGVTSPLSGWDLVRFVAELVLVVGVVILASSHGFYFGTRLQRLAEEERESAGGVQVAAIRAARHRLQRVSFSVSMTTLVGSLVLAVLAAIP